LEPRKKRSRRARWWIVFGLIFIVPSLFREMRSLLREELPAPPVPSEVFFLKSAPLTGNAGTERMPSFSPDGKQIVYSWDGPKADTFNLYVKRLGDDPSVRLTTNVHEDYAPAWSPDGATIAFLRSSRFSDDVLLIPASGGAERKIGEVAHIEGRYGLAWKKDSQHLIVSDAPSPGTPASLYELSIATAEKKRITKPSRKEEGDFFPSVSPEGNFLAFVRDPGSYRAELFTLDLTDEDADPQRIAAPRMEVTHPVWKPDGTQLIYGSGAGPVKLLWRVQADGSGKPMPLIGLSNGGEPAVSARGDRMIYSGTSKGNKTRSLFLVEEFR
jgi:Tol biopolymer transport system component